ncbi:MAG: ATP-dependent Clp protease ATP-binding subunit [Ruminococcaceae bacterium]|nr:ATP-dependent Clp protease ATP-binding subunit [Oscillospiraceae bacterium]
MANRFTQKAQNVLNLSLRIAAEMGHTYIGSEHLLLALLAEESGVASHYLRERGADPEKIKNAIAEVSGIGSPSSVSPSDMTPRTKSIIEASLQESMRYRQNYIGTEHLLLALLEEQDSVAVRLLDSFEVSISSLREDLIQYLSGTGAESSNAAQNRYNSSEKRSYDGKSALDSTTTLKNFGRDLTDQARAGALDPIIGRNEETERVIQILSRRTKNNPCLIGEPGVGKTAVVEGLAQRIVAGNVPETLREKSIVTLDIASMIAGAKYRGEFEERFKNVMEEVRKNSNIILFIDEIHTIIGAGAAEGAVDAANIIKPALARAEMQVIGATTIAEYRKHIEKDAALERRFQSVTVGEPTREDAILILKGLREKYEAHHKLKIEDEAIDAAVTLSVRYIPDRFLPDKAIDLIDEAASRLRISAHTSPPDLKALETEMKELAKEKEAAITAQEFERAAKLRDEEQTKKTEYETKKSEWENAQKGTSLSVTAQDVADVVTQWTGIPVSRLLEEESEKLLHLDTMLRERVIGQDDAVDAVARAIRRGRMGLKDPNRPIGSFIFMGPTGIGKTELAKALAEVMFGDRSAMIRLDMSEYMEKHSVSKLIGSPPGYVGFEEGGQLTERIRRKPYSVVLFDEIEKAHPDVFNILLQVLEDGILTDSQGRHVDFRNTVIILTSNVGAGEMKATASLGFTASAVSNDRDAMKTRMMQALRSTFRPEFLNRIDDIMIFNALEMKDIEKIVSLMLAEVAKRIQSLSIEITFDDSVPALLAKEGFDPTYGARPLRRAVVRLVEDTFSTEMLEGKIAAGDKILAKAEDGHVVFSKTE